MTCRAKAFRIGVLCLLGFTLLACQARAEWQVGATADTVRVLRSDPVPAAKAVAMAAARNETRSFQVFTRSDAPVAGVRLAAGDLRGPDGAVIPAGACELFREHLIDLVVGTYRNDKFKPDGYPRLLDDRPADREGAAAGHAVRPSGGRNARLLD